MERAGFSIRPQVSMYAGAQVCRFIDFEEEPCLESIEVANHKEYTDIVAEGMRMEDATWISFMSHRALRIPTSRLAWGLVIVEQWECLANHSGIDYRGGARFGCRGSGTEMNLP